MSEPAPDPPRSLEDLLQAWIDTETWKASHDFLATYAGQLLSEKAFVALDALLAVNSEKEGAARILKQHQTLLKAARDSSIDEAYIDLLMPSALQEALNALWQARPGGLPRVVEQHPLLLEAETIRVLLARASRIEGEGDPAWAQALRFHIGEVQRLRQQREKVRREDPGSPPVQEVPQSAEMSATRGGFNVYRNEGTINSTYVEHAEEEQRRFRLLGVFEPEAPITVEAAAAIWNLQNDINAAKQALSNLEDLAMLERYGADYRLHSLLYDYAYALLEDEGELTAAKWSHAEYYRDLARKKNAPGEYLLLDQHIQNLLAALAWAVEQEPVLFADLLEASEQFLRLRSQYSLLEQYLPRAVEIAKATGNNRLRANVRKAMGDVQQFRDEREAALESYEQALSLFRQVGSKLGEANCYLAQGRVARQQKDYQEALALHIRAYQLYQQIQDHYSQARLLYFRSWVYAEMEKQAQAIQDIESALLIARQINLPLIDILQQRLNELQSG